MNDDGRTTGRRDRGAPPGPRLSDADMGHWLIKADGGLELRVEAAYPTTDQNLPGWTLLKNARHKIVAMVRDESARTIERLDPPPTST